jgi:hypothetical protein
VRLALWEITEWKRLREGIEKGLRDWAFGGFWCGAANGKAGAGRVRCVAQASAPKRETDPKKRVVITGMGLVSVFGNDVDTFYDKLLEGTSGIDIIDRFDISKFPTKFAGQIRGFSANGYIDGKNDRRLDDSLRYCLVSGKKALEDAGLGGDDLNKVRLRNDITINLALHMSLEFDRNL